MVLCERTECDVRSCLNTLQFLARRGTRIRVPDITGLNVGQKDMTKGAFSIWTELLSTKVGAGPIPPVDCVPGRSCSWDSPLPLAHTWSSGELMQSVVAKTHSLTTCTEQHMICFVSSCSSSAPTSRRVFS